MKLGRVKKGRETLNVLATDQGVFALNRFTPTPPDDLLGCARAFSQGGLTIEPTGQPLDMSGVEHLTPIATPGKILCLGLNYALHAAEGGFTPPSFPTVFMRSKTSLTAHEQPIQSPACSDKLDFEAELAVIIGKEGYCISEAGALSHVAGYSVFNDGTLRDYQKLTPQWTVGKNFDRTGAFGPWLVTHDSLPEGAQGLRISSRLNGVTMQDANTSDMIFSVARTIELLSACMTLQPGDVLVMGTPEGVGYARTPPVYMKPGDECVIEIEGVGVLRNRVAPAPDASASG